MLDQYMGLENRREYRSGETCPTRYILCDLVDSAPSKQKGWLNSSEFPLTGCGERTEFRPADDSTSEPMLSFQFLT